MSATELEGRLLVDGELRPGRLSIADGRIVRVDLSAPPRGGEVPIIAPGLVDLHVHGFAGCDPRTDLGGMSAGLARAGTTAFLPTLFPRRSPEVLGAEAEAVSQAALALARGPGLRARVLGVHLEGPFVSPGAVGGLPAGELAAPSPAALAALLGPATGGGRGIRAVTLAPELPGALSLISELALVGMRVSLGHSLATAAEATRAVSAGAAGATHLFNAMRPLHHREAGLAGVALTADELLVEIIGDLVHVGRVAFELALRARGPRGLCLVSDSLAGSAGGGGRFCSHGKDCVVEDGAAWFKDASAPGGRRLTGTVLSQLDAVRRLVAAGVATPAEALTMASETPARALGEEREVGVLRPGARADLLVLAGADLALERVLLGGEPVEPATAAAPAGR